MTSTDQHPLLAILPTVQPSPDHLTRESPAAMKTPTMTDTTTTMPTPKFLTLTMQADDECVAEGVARAGGRGTQAEMADLRAQLTIRQRVHTDNVRQYIADLAAQGYRVIDVAYAVPPIARTPPTTPRDPRP